VLLPTMIMKWVYF